jgi:hypothetical protein
MTVDQVVNSFKTKLSKDDPDSIALAHEIGEKYGDVGRKLTPQEYVSAMHSLRDIPDLSDLPESQMGTILQGLSKPGKQQPGPPQEKSKGNLLTTPLLEGARKDIGTIAKAAADTRKHVSAEEEGGGVMAKARAWLANDPQKKGDIVERTGFLGLGSHERPPAYAGEAADRQKHEDDFSRGMAEGYADLGVDMTSPLNLGMMAASFLKAPAKLIEKFPRAIPIAKRLIAGGFAGKSALDMALSVPEAEAAQKRGDYEAAGKATAMAMGDLLFAVKATQGAVESTPGPKTQKPKNPRFTRLKEALREESTESRDKVNPPKTEAPPEPVRSRPMVSSDPRVSERVADPAHMEAVKAARGAAPPQAPRGRGRISLEPESRVDILREIGNLQETGSPEAESRINELRTKLGLPVPEVPPQPPTAPPAPHPEPTHPDVLPHQQFEFGPPPEPMPDQPQRTVSGRKPFPWENREARRGTAVPPVEGVPEGFEPAESGRKPAARKPTRGQGVGARDALAQKLLGQPFDSLGREDRQAVQTLLDEQKASAAQPKEPKKAPVSRTEPPPEPVRSAEPARRGTGKNRSGVGHAERYYPGQPVPEPGANAPPAAEPAVSQVGHSEVPESITSQVNDVVKTITASRGPTGESWKRMTVQPMTEGAGGRPGKPVGPPIEMEASDFTPEGLWQHLSKVKGVGWIKVSDAEFGNRSGSIFRPIDIGVPAPVR